MQRLSLSSLVFLASISLFAVPGCGDDGSGEDEIDINSSGESGSMGTTFTTDGGSASGGETGGDPTGDR